MYTDEAAQEKKRQTFLKSVAVKKLKDEEHRFVYSKIEECGNNLKGDELEKIYNLGIEFKKGKVIDYPHPEGSELAIRAAFLCFQYAKNLGFESAKLYHNMAMIFFHWKDRDKAEGLFMIASQMGLEASAKNLAIIKRQKEQEKHLELSQKEVLANNPVTALMSSMKMLNKESLANFSKEVISKTCNSMGVSINNTFLDGLTANFEAEAEAALNHLKNIATVVDKACASNTDTGYEQAFRLMPVASSAEEVKNALFKESQLLELKRIATLIYQQTKEDDLIVLLGRSPLWIGEMLRCFETGRQILNIPYSGGSKLGTTEILKIPEAAFSGFKAFLQSKGLNDSFFSKNPQRKLIIVDRVDTGASVIAFANLLGEMSPSFNHNSIKILGFGDFSRLSQSGTDNVQFFEMELDTLNETCKKHLDKQKFTLGVDFFPTEWEKWQEKDFDPKPSNIVVARQAQIKSWAANHPMEAQQKKIIIN